MDFIERLFHIAPDGGTGMLEVTIVLILIFIPAAILSVKRNRARRTRSVQPSSH